MAPVDPEVADALRAWEIEDDDWKGISRPCSAGEIVLAKSRSETAVAVGGWCAGDGAVSSRPASQPQFSQLSRPQSEQGPRQKPASQRFSPDELQCFKTRPLPSTEFEQKSQVYWQTFGELRQSLSDENWHALPVLKGQFYQHARFKESLGGATEAEKARAREKAQRLLLEKKKAEEVQPLATEAFVGDVLNRIFPRSNKKEDVGRASRHGRRQSMAFQLGRRASLAPPPKPMKESASAPSFKTKPSQPASIRSPLSPLLNTTVVTPIGARGAMEEFRRAILEKFSTVKEAFENFMKDLPDRQITKLELSRTLARYGFEWQTKDARDTIFDRLDFKSIGRVTMVGFYVIVEASAPVRSVEDLRRRWLASQFGSMHQAIMTMTEGSAHALSLRLSLQEFGERLLRVNVNEPEEHLALFKSLCYQKEHQKEKSLSKARVTIGDLASAVAVVSPCLLLEDLRDRLHKKYNGDFKRAFADLDMDRSGCIDQHEFVVKAMDRLSLTEIEARKMFREIDVDGSREISRNEFVCAIGLSEPSLFLEDLRKKVRQRFRSFKAQFANAFHDSALNECESAPRLNLQNFQELLLPLSMSEKETKVLFNLIDIDHDGHLSVREFVRGVRHFSPSAVLEDLRVTCRQQHEHITDAFPDVDFMKVMDNNAFSSYLIEVGLCDGKDSAELAGVPAQALFDILDVCNNGEATIGRLLAALQSCGAGTATRLSAEDLDMRARNDVKTDLAPMHKLVTDLKLQARMGMKYSEEENQETVQDEKASTRIFDAMLEQLDLNTSSSPTSKGNDESELPTKLRGPPRLKTLLYEDVLKQYSYQRTGKPTTAKPQVKPTKRPIHNASNGTQDSWLRMWANLKKSPKKHERQTLEADLQSYYQTAAWKLSHDGPLLHGIEQRLTQDPFLGKRPPELSS
ncbi:CALML5 [Symbiodinium necroappetens]|uniref:CALML5 protein n=1 Tax=Symbiodinium necroappetens TaxID=1628268 RepID=A0A812JV13_9DINO|nr:CALML5 [Symbiodinium necroappetens]